MQLDALAASAVNPLHELMIVAVTLKEMLAHEHGGRANILPELELPYSHQFEITEFMKNDAGVTIYPSKELAGVAGLYESLRAMGHEIIFANDLSLDIRGIDVIALNEKTNEYIICEAKGSSSDKIKTFSHYLKNTKSKGQQLSYKWCWASLVDYAFKASTAGIFLKLFEPIIHNKIQRMLCLSLLEECNLGYTIKNKKIWTEDEMSTKSWFRDSYDFSKQQKWYKEIHDANLLKEKD